MAELFRSLLFAPADKPRVAEKLARCGADAVVLDLEDAIPPNNRAAARVAAHAAVDALEDSGPAVFVRVNAPTSPWFDDDITAVSRMGCCGVVVPKAEDRATIERLADRLAADRADDVRIIVGIETAGGVAAGAAVLVPPVVACYFGAEDYIADVGGRRTPSNEEVRVARSMVVLSARLAGVSAIDQAVIDFGDSVRFSREATSGRDLGYVGKLCIHPRQVPLANDAFGVTDEELAMSREIVEAYERAASNGLGVIVMGGRMVDEPIARRARAVLALHAASSAAEGRRTGAIRGSLR